MSKLWYPLYQQEKQEMRSKWPHFDELKGTAAGLFNLFLHDQWTRDGVIDILNLPEDIPDDVKLRMIDYVVRGGMPVKDAFHVCVEGHSRLGWIYRLARTWDEYIRSTRVR